MIGTQEINTAEQVLSEQPLLQFGTVAAVSIAADKYNDTNITFPVPYASAPVVVACVNTTATTAQYGNITCFVKNVTATGFTLSRFLASANDTQSPGARWMAAGKRVI